MKRTLAILVLLWAWGLVPPAAAQTVIMRSGEHGDFTRLVAQVGGNRTWQVTQDDTSVVVQFAPENPQFDLSQIFSFIARDRIQNVAATDGLTLELGCECIVSVTRFQDSYMIIDVSEATEPDQLPAAHPPLPLFIESEPSRQIIPDFSDDADANDQDRAPIPEIDMETAAALLAEQMARATAAGLLDPAPLQSLAAGDPVTPQESSPALAAEDINDHVEALPPPAALPITTNNAFDLNTSSDTILITATRSTCMPPPTHPLRNWDGGMSFSHGVGLLRSHLYNDRDQLAASAAMELAEFYLAHGFGAEALHWISEIGDPAPFHSAMARYYEFGTTNGFGPVAPEEGCDPDVVFWQFLTSSNPPRLELDARRMVLATFFGLPDGMRDRLGPDLARQFAETGQDGAALEIRQNLLIGGRLGNQELAFLGLALESYQTGDTEIHLTPGNAGTTNANRAMTHQLLAQIQDFGRVRPADLDAAEALLLESNPPLVHRGLRHVTAMGHAMAGNVEAMVFHLQSPGEEDVPEIFYDIVAALMQAEQTAELLILLTSDSFGQFGQYPGPAARRNVAEYFLEHGMPEFARDILLAGGHLHARDQETLQAALERMSRDRNTAEAAAALPIAELVPPMPTPPTDAAGALAQSRDLRGEISMLLSGN